MLLDDYLLEFDVRTSYATRIAGSPARVYASLWTANFDHWGVTRALYAVRTLPSFPVRPRETWRRVRDELFRKRSDFRVFAISSANFFSSGNASLYSLDRTLLRRFPNA